MEAVRQGRRFRDAWIEGVRKHHPGEPKASYVVPWDEMPAWERIAANTVGEMIRELLSNADEGAAKLTREQKGRFVAICWLTLVYQLIADPKPGYVADWDDMPEWQRETDADIFEAFQAALGR